MNFRDQLVLTSAVGMGLCAMAGTSWAQSAQNGLDEIVVTAQKVQSTVQNIPVAISTITGDQLLTAGIHDAIQLQKAVPGLQVSGVGPGAASIYIRGIGNSVLNAFRDPSNAFSIDGVYFNRPTGPNQSFYDLQRVEVVKGPQGTAMPPVGRLTLLQNALRLNKTLLI